VTRVLRELADALACAHAAGVVHWDVKPENVLFQHGVALLTDFGVARALDAEHCGFRLTSTGLGLGTLGYMAPEQLAGEQDVDARADLYALGVLAYEMLTGAPPFAGATPVRLMTLHLTERPRPVGEVQRDVPPALSGLVARLLEKEPADRPRRAGDVLRDLEAIGAPRRPRARTPSARDAAAGGTPHDPFFAFLATFNVRFTDEQVAWVESVLVPRTFRKGQFFLRPGHVPTHGAFVTRGLFRTYTIDANGNESITRLLPEGAWMGDLPAAAAGTPTDYCVEAIEPSEALLFDGPSFDRLLEVSPDFRHGFRMGLQQSRDAMERRIALYLHASADERYADFVARQPALALRVPQRMLASYLGITPETLSRIRRRLKEG
jgi:serine/threonine-protein kinase